MSTSREPGAGAPDPRLTKALTAIKDLRAKIDALEDARRAPLAVVGIGCRLPGGVTSAASFWHLLENGVDGISEVPASRWDMDAFYDPDPETPGRTAVRYGGFLDDVDAFDPYFFGISPREAERMDPQQRLFLEVAWEALEDAGLTRKRLSGSATGVFVGTNCSDYLQMQLADPADIDTYTVLGGLAFAIPNRLSYLLDLRGPSMAMDTACSSSLVAVHTAATSLRTGECDTAVVGGMNLILSPHAMVAHTKGLPIAADGRCKTFDARADGYVRGEGVCAVVLKRLPDAVAAGDRIWAVIRGTAVNQDGLTNGLAAPNGRSQRDVIEQALANARLEPSQITLLEAHGTGTSLGDPIEVEALDSVYGRVDEDGDSCALGSVKTNVGHVEAGAGLVGMIKTALSVHHRRIIPNLHFETINPHLSLDDSRLYIPTAPRDWDVPDERCHAAVSSFGAGGTNAHVILGPAPAARPVTTAAQDAATGSGPWLIPVSAPTRRALAPMAAAYRDFLLSAPGRAVPLGDIAWSAAHRRTHHEHRCAVVADSHEEAAEQLTEWLEGRGGTGVVTGSTTSAVDRGVVFVFPGQGSPGAGTGSELMDTCPVFRDTVTEADAALRRWTGRSVVEEIHGAGDAGDDRAEPRGQGIGQPALFAVGVGLAAHWRSLGLEPDAVIGHSMGEVAAAYVAGVLSLDDAARIVCRRADLLGRIHGRGTMLAAALPRTEAEALLDGRRDRVSVAVCNSAVSTMFSGDPAALDEIAHELRARNVLCRPVGTDIAWHSPQTDPLRADLLAALAGITPRTAKIPVLSGVTGRLCDGTGFDAAYWARQLREPVLFGDGVGTLLEGGHGVFVEMSPHPTLLSAVEQVLEPAGKEGLLLPFSRSGEGERRAMTASLGALHAHGFPVPADAVFPAEGRAVALPSYAWQRERFWFRSGPRAGSTGPAPASSPTASPVPSPAPSPVPPPTAGTRDRAPAGHDRDGVFTAVLDAVSDLLHLDRERVDPDSGFFQMGMDSLLATQVRRRVEARLGRKLPATVMFEHPTVNGLTDHLAEAAEAAGTVAPDTPRRHHAAQESVEESVEGLSEDRLLAILADEIRATGSTR
ncbi:type I polyketide synthase [Streptomyces syringium]|uniref:Acyl transferase domain-containing protein n=1 Tax=Streptomyces syringium TaxID=76729 RepID=A0ABS4XZG4_9ACTN|nr:type I polyketide synthase [Streptomyces syringium]MBP2401705.1 acyl transferase domain-containing protein [Streptomyces syringium]